MFIIYLIKKIVPKFLRGLIKLFKYAFQLALLIGVVCLIVTTVGWLVSLFIPTAAAPDELGALIIGALIMVFIFCVVVHEVVIVYIKDTYEEYKDMTKKGDKTEL